MDKLRVVHSRRVWLAKTETWLFNQVKYLRSDIKPHIVCTATDNLDQFYVDNIHCIGKMSPVEAKYEEVLRKCGIRNYRGRAFRLIKGLEPNVFHSHFGHEAWNELNLVKKLGVKHIVTFYGHDVNRMPTVSPIWAERYKDLFDSVDQVLCEGPHMAACIVKLGCPAEKVRVHHLGVSLKDIPYQPRQWKPGTVLRVLIAAAFKEKKGIPYALGALGRLKDDVPLQITIIGDATHEEPFLKEKAHIHEIIEEYRLEPYIRFMGFQPHSVLLEEAYKHHIFLSPSVTAQDGDTEGGAPVSIIEMAASGMPVVSTFHCDISEVIKDGETGLLAQERNVDELCEKLLWLVNNVGSWRALLDSGRKHIEGEFDAQAQGIRLSAIYEEVANKSSP